jgi:hypothetical protein
LKQLQDNIQEGLQTAGLSPNAAKGIAQGVNGQACGARRAGRLDGYRLRAASRVFPFPLALLLDVRQRQNSGHAYVIDILHQRRIINEHNKDFR